MRWVRDASGRFPKRPHYTNDELEQVCAELTSELQRLRPREWRYPLSLDDLTVLIEQRAADLDLYADLSAFGSDVEAVTDFAPDQRPRVRVAERLSSLARFAPRLRTTLGHELAHVVLHNFIWWFTSPEDVGHGRAAELSPRCGPVRVSTTDWMEWQANFAASALLMPAVELRSHFGEPRSIWVRERDGRALVREVQRAFGVSSRAASVRLLQLGYLGQRPRVVARAPVPRWTG